MTDTNTRTAEPDAETKPEPTSAPALAQTPPPAEAGLPEMAAEPPAPMEAQPELALAQSMDEDPAESEEQPDAEVEEEEAAPRTTFADLGLSDELLRAVTDTGYLHPTPIQEQAIPVVLMNRDVLGCAQTGTGKTASFVLPMLDILSGSRAKARMPRSLILEPTRELALQVA